MIFERIIARELSWFSMQLVPSPGYGIVFHHLYEL